MAKKQQAEDPAMVRVRTLVKESGLSLHELGLKMGCPPETARQSVWQFLRTADPHISVLRRFAEALGVTIEELVAAKSTR
jgi:transcriptional regulator with XRE-family HTH domain